MALMKPASKGPKGKQGKAGQSFDEKHPRGPGGQFKAKNGASSAKGETKGMKGSGTTAHGGTAKKSTAKTTTAKTSGSRPTPRFDAKASGKLGVPVYSSKGTGALPPYGNRFKGVKKGSSFDARASKHSNMPVFVTGRPVSGLMARNIGSATKMLQARGAKPAYITVPTKPVKVKSAASRRRTVAGAAIVGTAIGAAGLTGARKLSQSKTVKPLPRQNHRMN